MHTKEFAKMSGSGTSGGVQVCSNYLLKHPNHAPLGMPRGAASQRGLMSGLLRHFKTQLFCKLGLSSETKRTFKKEQPFTPASLSAVPVTAARPRGRAHFSNSPSQTLPSQSTSSLSLLLHFSSAEELHFSLFPSPTEHVANPGSSELPEICEL